ncbi:MAG TPA: hypothetical protein VKY32_01580 [Flavobacterium sp.]|nr:hypothetical protein [Flavobacterium sp.]
MFELFKKRDFGELFNDTFGFFKLKWKNYFGNYLKINFLILILTMVFGYIISKFYMDTVFGSLSNSGQFNPYIDNYIADNSGWMLLIGLGMLIILIILSIIQMSYPVFYMKLLENNTDFKPKSGEISSLIRQNFGRMLLFCFVTFFVVGFMLAVAAVIASFLMIIIIGIFLIILLIPYFSALVYLSLFHYINKKSGYFEALGFAFNTLHNNFWKIVGCNLIIYMIIQLVTTIISMVPYVIIFAIGFASMSDAGSFENADWMVYSFGVLYAVTLLVSMLLNNVIIINFGLIYYGEMEKRESVFAQSEIDQIGLDE